MIDLSRLLCMLGGHLAETGAMWNQGYAFSRCRRCEREIVRSLIGPWRLPPRGYRVVWRQAGPVAGPSRPNAGRGDHGAAAIDFMADGGPDFRWTAEPPPCDRPADPEPYDFMRDEPLPPRARGRR